MCSQCEVLAINGIVCHETGCPVSWKDYKLECFECGLEFEREEEYDTVCISCQEVLTLG